LNLAKVRGRNPCSLAATTRRLQCTAVSVEEGGRSERTEKRSARRGVKSGVQGAETGDGDDDSEEETADGSGKSAAKIESYDKIKVSGDDVRK
jgi:hypothetical protein